MAWEIINVGVDKHRLGERQLNLLEHYRHKKWTWMYYYIIYLIQRIISHFGGKSFNALSCTGTQKDEQITKRKCTPEH